jgi:hypothetical protein
MRLRVTGVSHAMLCLYDGMSRAVMLCAVLCCYAMLCRFGFKSDLLRAMYAVTDGFRSGGMPERDQYCYASAIKVLMVCGP